MRGIVDGVGGSYASLLCDEWQALRQRVSVHVHRA